ncbi:MAG: arsenate reductase ArsC [Actinobacteria bacterium]|nr:arsenate reductase ArsC [Actinomycetota bacterium]
MSQEDLLGSDAVVQARLAEIAKRLEREFEGIHDAATVRQVLDESARQVSGGGVGSYVTILAERFARERLTASAQVAGTMAKEAPQVVFVSLTGGGRAQIGAALLARRMGAAVDVHSAGSETSVADVDENVRAAMESMGIDLSEAFSKPLTQEILANADVLVTMGRSVGEFEIPSGVRHLDWRIGNPAGAEPDEVRRVCEDIERRVEALVAQLATAAVAAG